LGLSSGAIGDFHTDIITVKGNVNHFLTIPWVKPWNWDPTTDNAQGAPQIYVLLDSISVSGDQTPQVVCLAWFAAGDDFVYDSYQLATVYGNTSVAQQRTAISVKSDANNKKESVKGQTDVTKLFAKTIFPVISGFAQPQPVEDKLNVEDLLLRWSGRSSGLVATDTRVHAWTPNTVSHYPYQIVQNWDFLCNMFMYNSGSVRRKVFYDPTDEAHSYCYGWLQSVDPANDINNYASVCDGMFGTAVDQLPVMDFLIPYIARFVVDVNPMWVTTGLEPPGYEVPMGLRPDSDAIDDSWIKAGNNFRLHFLQPLLGRAFWPWTYNPATMRKSVALRK